MQELQYASLPLSADRPGSRIGKQVVRPLKASAPF